MLSPVYIAAGVLVFAAFAVFQHWTLKNGLTRSIRNMPLVFALVAVFMSLMIYSGAFGGDKAALGFTEKELYGLSFGMISACALFGDFLGWIVFKMTNKQPKPQPKKKNNKKKKK